MFLYVYLYITIYYEGYEIRFQKIICRGLLAYLFFSTYTTLLPFKNWRQCWSRKAWSVVVIEELGREREQSHKGFCVRALESRWSRAPDPSVGALPTEVSQPSPYPQTHPKLPLNVSRIHFVFQTVGGQLHCRAVARVYGMTEISGRGNFNKGVSSNIQQRLE